MISKLNEAAKGTLDNYSLNVISRAKKFGEKIKFMSLHPTSDEVYEVLCSKDKHDAAYILSTVMAAIEQYYNRNELKLFIPIFFEKIFI